MHEVYESIRKSLIEVSEHVIKINGAEATLKDQQNWQFPSITKEELGAWPRDIADRITLADDDDAPANIKLLKDFPRRLASLQIDTIPHMFGNHPGVYAYTATLDALERALAASLAFVIVDDPRMLPAKTSRRLKSVNRAMDQIDNDHEELQSRVDGINNAYSAAQSLPTTLQELEEARAELEEMKQKIEALYLDCAKTQGKIEASSTASDTELKTLQDHAKEADKLIRLCEDAYQITTTKGLAAAFDQRATRLNYSIVLWVVGLLIALIAGALVGSQRLNALTLLASVPQLSWGQVSLHMLFAMLGIGAPLWFAWLATKQIGQRFRLAEDYAFKASVAKAYEGYRKQAALYDEEFSARLFASALTRLEEAPLRLVEQDSHGSPWHEVMRSDVCKRAMSTIPQFQEKVAEFARQALDTASSKKTKSRDEALSGE